MCPVRLSKLLPAFSLVFLTLLLAGCATVATAPDPLKAGASKEGAVVVVSVTANTSQIKGFDGLTVRRIQGPGARVNEQSALNIVAPGMSRDTSVFVGQLPEGEYDFVEFRDNKTQKFLTLSDGNRQLIGSFKVAPGQSVDLGRLVLTPVNNKVILGRSALAKSNKPLLEQFAPEYAAFLAGETSTGWTELRTTSDLVEEYARTRPVGFDSPSEAEDGTLFGASRLGSVLVRTPTGDWRVIRANRLESLLCAMPVKMSNAVLIATGELNTLLRLPPGGKELVPIDVGNLPAGNLMFIAGNESTGWYLAKQRDTQVALYRSLKLEKGDWQLVRQETVEPSFWSGPSQIWFWRTPQGFSYATTDGRINSLDFANGDWRSFKAPKEHRLLDVSPNPDGSIGILTSPGGGFGGVFSGVFLSQDQGAAWRDIAPKYKIKNSVPFRFKSGTMMTMSRASAFSGQVELHASRDDGVSWEKVEGYRLGEGLVPLQSGRLLSVQPGLTGIFTLTVSSDEGQTWRVEYSNFDKAAYDAQQKKN